MSELFPTALQPDQPQQAAPLADRIRPRSIDEIKGQDHLLGQGAPLRSFFESKDFPSLIFWGPPGVGKTTIAALVASIGGYSFVQISAVDSGVKEVRQVIASAQKLSGGGRRSLLFIDEIHRFNKSQQDALLHAVEKGIITLIGATTENPSFEVNPALLSRCQVYKLYPLADEDIRTIVESAIQKDELLGSLEIVIENWDVLFSVSGGDARNALNAVEIAVRLAKAPPGKPIKITRLLLEKAIQQKTAYYDKKGDYHYDTISAFIKSMRGSDPDAAIFWLAKMLDAGEDPKFIARRMVIFASEDVGNADPLALVLAVAVFQAIDVIGMPEGRINLAQGVTYLASCPKSNASYMAIENATADIKSGADTTVPLHIRNAPTRLMKEEGYGEGYKYPHSFEGHFVGEHYFPDSMEPRLYYKPGGFGREKQFRERLAAIWKKRFK